jgi:hypothetical protein
MDFTFPAVLLASGVRRTSGLKFAATFEASADRTGDVVIALSGAARMWFKPDGSETEYLISESATLLSSPVSKDGDGAMRFKLNLQFLPSDVPVSYGVLGGIAFIASEERRDAVGILRMQPIEESPVVAPG